MCSCALTVFISSLSLNTCSFLRLTHTHKLQCQLWQAEKGKKRKHTCLCVLEQYPGDTSECLAPEKALSFDVWICWVMNNKVVEIKAHSNWSSINWLPVHNISIHLVKGGRGQICYCEDISQILPTLFSHVNTQAPSYSSVCSVQTGQSIRA